MLATFSRINKVKRRLYITLTICAFLCICGALVYKTHELKKEETKKTYELTQAQEKYAAEQDRTDEIEEHKAYVQTKKYAEEVAREKFGMVYKDEVIFTPKDDSDNK